MHLFENVNKLFMLYCYPVLTLLFLLKIVMYCSSLVSQILRNYFFYILFYLFLRRFQHIFILNISSCCMRIYHLFCVGYSMPFGKINLFMLQWNYAQFSLKRFGCYCNHNVISGIFKKIIIL